VVRRIEESVLIDAPREVAWRTLVDLTCWADWSSVLTRVVPEGDARLADGARFSCSLRPFGVVIPFAVRVEVAEAPARLLWVAARWGVRGRHWFHFLDKGGGTRCDSVEDLSGPTVVLAGPLFPEWRFRELTRRFLSDLKAGAEGRARGG
jgi:ligand-binding SRPBCC domain-containing protein